VLSANDAAGGIGMGGGGAAGFANDAASWRCAAPRSADRSAIGALDGAAGDATRGAGAAAAMSPALPRADSAAAASRDSAALGFGEVAGNGSGNEGAVFATLCAFFSDEGAAIVSPWRDASARAAG